MKKKKHDDGFEVGEIVVHHASWDSTSIQFWCGDEMHATLVLNDKETVSFLSFVKEVINRAGKVLVSSP